MNRDFLYNVGDIVNENLLIVNQTRENKRKEKSYVVQSAVYPDAPTYIVTEGNLKMGRGDAYASNRKIYEGNSLWSKTEYRKYIVDIEEAKKIAPSANKKIKVICPNCKIEKTIAPSNMINREGIGCKNCKGIVSEYRYKEGDIVEGLKIIRSYRNKSNGLKSYEVQSVKYSDAPTYQIRENNLINGCGDAYLSGKRIYEGNSLYSKKQIRPYLVDVELAKTIAPHHNHKIKLKCPDCNRIKSLLPGNFLKQGFSCDVCSVGKSYNEIMFMCYQEYFSMGFESEKVFNKLPHRRFDFYNKDKKILVECNGIGHYESSGYIDHNKSIASDKEKREFAKKEGFLLIELDCRESSFEWFVKSINNCRYLPSISNEDKKGILKMVEVNKKYPIKKIVTLYKEGYSSVDIENKLNIHNSTIKRILLQNGVQMRSRGEYSKRKVECLNNKKIFNSIVEASEYAGLKSCSGIGDACKNQNISAGKHPKTKEKLYWKYV